jgi:hypothetical protein
MADNEVKITMFDLLEDLQRVLQSADPVKLRDLAETFQAYHDDCPDEFRWAFGAQAPSLLYHLMNTIGGSCLGSGVVVRSSSKT